MSQNRFKVGMAQMLVEGGNPDRNLARAVDRIREASDAGCAAIVLPECLDIGWTHPSARSLARTVPGPYSETLGRAALEADIFVVAGLTERHKDRLYNTAVLISPEGHIRLKHRKINVLDIAQDLYEIGDSLSVAHTRLGTIGVNICADNFSNSLALAHSLARMGAQILLSPSAWALDLAVHTEGTAHCQMWRDSYTEITQLYDITVVGVSNVGPVEAGVWAGRHCIGYSMAIGPGGKVLAQAPFGKDADVLEIAEVELLEPAAKGTDIAGELEARGYKGP